MYSSTVKYMSDRSNDPGKGGVQKAPLWVPKSKEEASGVLSRFLARDAVDPSRKVDRQMQNSEGSLPVRENTESIYARVNRPTIAPISTPVPKSAVGAAKLMFEGDPGDKKSPKWTFRSPVKGGNTPIAKWTPGLRSTVSTTPPTPKTPRWTFKQPKIQSDHITKSDSKENKVEMRKSQASLHGDLGSSLSDQILDYSMDSIEEETDYDQEDVFTSSLNNRGSSRGKKMYWPPLSKSKYRNSKKVRNSLRSVISETIDEVSMLSFSGDQQQEEGMVSNSNKPSFAEKQVENLLEQRGAQMLYSSPSLNENGMLKEEEEMEDDILREFFHNKSIGSLKKINSKLAIRNSINHTKQMKDVFQKKDKILWLTFDAQRKISQIQAHLESFSNELNILNQQLSIKLNKNETVNNKSEEMKKKIQSRIQELRHDKQAASMDLLYTKNRHALQLKIIGDKLDEDYKNQLIFESKDKNKLNKLYSKIYKDEKAKISRYNKESKQLIKMNATYNKQKMKAKGNDKYQFVLKSFLNTIRQAQLEIDIREAKFETLVQLNTFGFNTKQIQDDMPNEDYFALEFKFIDMKRKELMKKYDQIKLAFQQEDNILLIKEKSMDIQNKLKIEIASFKDTLNKLDVTDKMYGYLENQYRNKIEDWEFKLKLNKEKEMLNLESNEFGDYRGRYHDQIMDEIVSIADNIEENEFMLKSKRKSLNNELSELETELHKISDKDASKKLNKEIDIIKEDINMAENEYLEYDEIINREFGDVINKGQRGAIWIEGTRRRLQPRKINNVIINRRKNLALKSSAIRNNGLKSGFWNKGSRFKLQNMFSGKKKYMLSVLLLPAALGVSYLGYKHFMDKGVHSNLVLDDANKDIGILSNTSDNGGIERNNMTFISEEDYKEPDYEDELDDENEEDSGEVIITESTKENRKKKDNGGSSVLTIIVVIVIASVIIVASGFFVKFKLLNNDKLSSEKITSDTPEQEENASKGEDQSKLAESSEVQQSIFGNSANIAIW